MLFDIDPNLRHIRNLKERYIQFNKQYGNNPKQTPRNFGDPKLWDCLQ